MVTTNTYIALSVCFVYGISVVNKRHRPTRNEICAPDMGNGRQYRGKYYGMNNYATGHPQTGKAITKNATVIKPLI